MRLLRFFSYHYQRFPPICKILPPIPFYVRNVTKVPTYVWFSLLYVRNVINVSENIRKSWVDRHHHLKLFGKGDTTIAAYYFLCSCSCLQSQRVVLKRKWTQANANGRKRRQTKANGSEKIERKWKKANGN